MADEDKTPENKPADKAPEPSAAEIANRAATEHGKRIEKKLREEYDAKLAALREELSAAKTAPPKEDEPSEEKETIKSLAKKMKDQEAKFNAEREQAKKNDEAKEAKVRATEARATVESALRDAGVANVKGAFALLRAEERVAYDEDGKLVIKLGDSLEDECSVKDGLAKWLSSDDGKHYLPPVGSGGSGQTGKTRGKRAADGKMTKEEADETIMSAFFGQRR